MAVLGAPAIRRLDRESHTFMKRFVDVGMTGIVGGHAMLK